VIFAFGGNALICTGLLCRSAHQRRAAVGRQPGLPNFVFWGWNVMIVLAASSYILGGSQGKEYAEPVWYIDLLDHGGLGGLPGRLCGHADAAERAPYLCGELVLPVA
jgi:hypothetical protein